MPYIKQTQRTDLDPFVNVLIYHLSQQEPVDVDGQLNYIITRLLKNVYQPKYFNFNRAMGMLECVKQEFYRTVVGPYEDVKRQESGDVFD